MKYFIRNVLTMLYRQSPVILICFLASITFFYSNAEEELLQAIVLDAGSTGTRAHVFNYRWIQQLCLGQGAPFLSLPEMNEKITPGVSKLRSLDMNLGEYLHPIRKFINLRVLEPRRKYTPLYFRGTAGMRSLNESIRGSMLDEVRIELSTWGYLFELEWASVLDGKEEGIYGWFMVNQALGTFDPDMRLVSLPAGSRTCSEAEKTHEDMDERVSPRVNIFEVGGASAQIVSEMNVRNDTQRLPGGIFSKVSNSYNRGPSNVQFQFCGRSFDLYANSYQGLGVDLAFEQLVLNMAEKRDAELNREFEELHAIGRDIVKDRTNKVYITQKRNESIPVPCLQRGASVVVGDSSIGDDHAIETYGLEEFDCELEGCSDTDKVRLSTSLVLSGSRMAHGLGHHRSCRDSIVSHLLSQYRPIPVDLKHTPLYCLENCFYINRDVRNVEQEVSTTSDWQKSADEMCKDHMNLRSQKSSPTTWPILHERACFTLTFFLLLFEQQLRLTEHEHIVSTQNIGGADFSWVSSLVLFEVPKHYPQIHKLRQN
eukprot:GHVR01177544.1.p1 GENE.GHVR01177544.1~~GHVR01177544.1.p1  ORF type:complete len:541 (+),score=41.16 GHVR01177544.1:24-1646(+)